MPVAKHSMTHGCVDIPAPKLLGMIMAKNFREMIANYRIKGKTSTMYNPQSNGIIEQVHQTLANSLRTLELEEQELDAHDPWSPFLSAATLNNKIYV